MKLTPNQSKKLKKLGVQAVYLFGSRALGLAHARSDYDYAVLHEKSGHKRGGKLYQELYEILSEISPRTLRNDVIDIVFLRDVGLEIQFHVVQNGKVIFDRDPSARYDFTARTTLLYCDFRPVLVEMDRVILEGL